jgi:hypothetical protein
LQGAEIGAQCGKTGFDIAVRGGFFLGGHDSTLRFNNETMRLTQRIGA